jgi:hypothetical protein
MQTATSVASVPGIAHRSQLHSYLPPVLAAAVFVPHWAGKPCSAAVTLIAQQAKQKRQLQIAALRPTTTSGGLFLLGVTVLEPSIGHVYFTPGDRIAVFQQRDGRQYVLDNEGQCVYGDWDMVPPAERRIDGGTRADNAKHLPHGPWS